MIKSNPEYVKIGDRKYKINTSFKVALRCNEVIMDESISDYERSLAVIYLLFGDEALENKEDIGKLMELAYKYLCCGEEKTDEEREEPDMDFIQDYNLIRASFKSDYGIDINEEDLHWWDFYTYLNGLSDTCVLNRIRELRTYDTSDLDFKEKTRIEKAKKRFRLKPRKKIATQKEKDCANKFYELMGMNRKE